MNHPVNHFKRALSEQRRQIGLWAGLADAYAIEALASVGFDWLLLDAEHAPNDVRSVLSQLQSVAAYKTHPIVRPPVADPVLIKQYLDIGAQTLLLPMIDSSDQAARAVAATRYPPSGKRGVGSALARSSRWNQIPEYLQKAERELCVLVQAESTSALRDLRLIAQVDGVDGVFFGPADLSASMGLLGQPGHPAVKQAILEGIATVRAAGKAAGVLAVDRALAAEYLSAGAQFVAVGVDTTLLVRSAAALLAQFRSDSSVPTSSASAY